MKRVWVLLLLFGLAFAAKVPVTALHLVPGVLWPAPTYRVLGPECDQLVAKVPLPQGKALKDAQCYRMVVANPDDAATYLYFLARGLSQSFKLLKEEMKGEDALVQVWRGKPGTLYLYLKLEKSGFSIVAGWLVEKPAATPANPGS